MYTRHGVSVEPGGPGEVDANISAELFTIPLDDGKFIVYAPLRRAAFLANSALVDFIARLQETGIIDEAGDPAIRADHDMEALREERADRARLGGHVDSPYR